MDTQKKLNGESNLLVVSLWILAIVIVIGSIIFVTGNKFSVSTNSNTITNSGATTSQLIQPAQQVVKEVNIRKQNTTINYWPGPQISYTNLV